MKKMTRGSLEENNRCTGLPVEVHEMLVKGMLEEFEIQPLYKFEPELDKLSEMMEEMANAPKEEYGKRQPGERGMYETARTL